MLIRLRLILRAALSCRGSATKQVLETNPLILLRHIGLFWCNYKGTTQFVVVLALDGGKRQISLGERNRINRVCSRAESARMYGEEAYVLAGELPHADGY